MEFKVGDRVEVTAVINKDTAHWNVGSKATWGINGYLNADRKIENSSMYASLYKFKKIGAAMSLRTRIEALENGWDKEADDLLQEIIEAGYGNGSFIEFGIKIVVYKNITNTIYVRTKTNNSEKTFSFDSQCEKNQAFKDALLWLLDKSGLEKAEKRRGEIEELKEKVTEIECRIKEIEGV